MFKWFKNWIVEILSSGTAERQRPQFNDKNESNIPGLYIVGDLAGAPVIKLAMEQGYKVVDHISSLPDAKGNDPDIYDLLVVGAGAAGLNGALVAKEKGLSCVVLEKGKIANTIENFPEGKWVYAEPNDDPPLGKLWLDGATKEDLIKRWNQIIEDNRIDVRSNEPLEGLEKKDGIFIISSSKNSYKAKRVLLATGQRGNPRRLGIEGEDRDNIYHQLYSPKSYHDENIIVVGGGNSAIEAAIALCEKNKVYLSYRKGSFARIFKNNEALLKEKVKEGKIEPILSSEVTEFGEGEAILRVNKETRNIPYSHAFVLVGAELPKSFLKSIKVKMENEWNGSILLSLSLVLLFFVGVGVFGDQFRGFGINISESISWYGSGLALVSFGLLIGFGLRGNRYSWLGIAFIICYSIYGIKLGNGLELWPFNGWAYNLLSVFERPWAFWYTVLYSVIMTMFGFKAIKRWGLDRQDRYQVWRYISLLGFQWIFFFIIPEFLFQWAIEYRWIGEKLANDPNFTEQGWRAYGIIYAWPLFFYTFFYNPHQIWIIWGILLTFVVVPIFIIWNGKRYCSWICGCGGLAETLGDRWRHLAPKGRFSIKLEGGMGLSILIFATITTILILLKDLFYIFYQPADLSVSVYKLLVDLWLVGIIPLTLYPFLGGKVWCRYWCPLAKLMHIMSKLSVKLGLSKFRITSNSKCIGCYECSRNCQVGIDVMSYGLKQEVLDNSNSSCIGCGICVTACPMDVLKFGEQSN